MNYKNYYIIFSIIIGLAFCFVEKTLSILVFTFIGLVTVLIISRKLSDNIFKKLLIVLWIQIIFMLCLYISLQLKYGAPYFMGGSDDLFIEKAGKYIINQNYLFPYQLEQDSFFSYNPATNFLWLFSYLMRFSNIFGSYNTFCYRILNCFFLQALGILVFKFVNNKKIIEKKLSNKLFLAITLFPNCMYITSHVFRDTLSILLLFSAFYIIFVNENIFQNKKVFKTLSLLIIVSLLAYLLRTQNIFYIISFMFIKLFLGDKKIRAKNAILVLCLFVFLFFIFEKLGVIDSFLKYNEQHTDYLEGWTNGIENKIFALPLFPFGFITRLLISFVSPMPTYILKVFTVEKNFWGFLNLIISLGIIGQIYFLPYLFKNIKRIDYLTLSYLIILFSVVTTTFGFRHFIMLYPFMFMLIAREYSKTKVSTRWIFFFGMTLCLFILSAIYMFIN